MHFIADPDVTREVGADLLSALEPAVLPDGECAACGEELGDGAIRWSFASTPSMALLATSHATCGPTQLQQGDWIRLVDGSWRTLGVYVPRDEETTTRQRLWRRKKTIRSTVNVPCIVVSPASDVFYLYRSADGSLISPVQRLLEKGFRKFNTQSLYPSPTPSNVAVDLLDDRISVKLDVADEYEIYGVDELALQIEEVGGLLLAVTHALDNKRLAARVKELRGLHDMLTSPHTAVAWVPASDIAGLNSSSTSKGSL